MNPATPTAPATPRPSASLIIVNERNEILLVHRNPKASTFAGMHVSSSVHHALSLSDFAAQVFPGGNFDQKQDDSLQTTAIRETFEETGLLVASASHDVGLSDTDLNTARERIHSQKQLFRDFLDKHGISIDTSSLLPFTQWITPPNVARQVFLSVSRQLNC